MTVCKKCSSTDIAQMEWVNVNSGGKEGIVNDGGQENEDRWCNKCEEHVEFKEVDL